MASGWCWPACWLDIPRWAFLLIVVGAHIIFTQTDLNYLIPRVIGRRVRLAPLVVILGIVAGAALAGVLGVVLAAPTIATGRVIGRYIYSRLFEMDALDEPATQPLPPPEFRWWRKYRTGLPRRLRRSPAEPPSDRPEMD
ncbi:MAG: AI-2E family transporter [Anaerolineaceae bacterium]